MTYSTACTMIRMQTLQTLQCLFLLYFLLTTVAEETEKALVHLNHGTVRGEVAVDEHNNTFYAFRGIPYAEPPVNHLRYKRPVPKQPWDGMLDALNDGPLCPQIAFFNVAFGGTEDNCLTLNVYTPQLPSSGSDAKLDVVFHIHGGGFAAGNGGEHFLYGAKRFMPKEKNIVLVSPNYRVGSIGFFSTNDSSAPGNYGLLDQLEALRWVRNNIDKFGGDPTKVTLFGESAGGASVMYHLLSPLSKGLFHRAVAMSGTPLNLWAYQYEPQYWAKRLAEKVKCKTRNTERMVKCLKTKSAKEVVTSEDSIDTVFKVSRPARFLYSPSLDREFLLDTPYNIIKNKQYNNVPLLIGVTKDEGNCWFRFNNPKPDGEFTDEEIYYLIQTMFNGNTNIDKAVQMVKDEYFTSSHKSEDVHNSYAKLVTDGFFQKYHYLTVKMMVERGSKLYVYSYDYEGTVEGIKNFVNISGNKKIGVCHGFDLANFFNSELFGKDPLKGKDQEMKENMQKLFFNFILKGTPNSDDVKVKWPQAEPGKIHVYHIDEQNSASVYDANKDGRFKFWAEDIPKTLGHPYLSTTPSSSVKAEL